MTVPETRSFREKYRFVLTSRWLGLIAFAIVASVVCVFLGMWQWDRYEVKAERLERMDAAWDAPVWQIDDALENGLAVTESTEWHRVELTGEYVGSALVRNRPVDSRPALHHVGILLTERDQGEMVVVVVNRGWFPADDPEPALPTGPQVVETRLRIDEPAAGRTAPEGQAYNYNASDLMTAAGLAEELSGVPVLQGVAQVVEADEGLGDPVLPERSLGNHLSYAFQWWFFAAAIPVGLVILARREAMDELAMAVAGIGAPRRRSEPTDEELEDRLVDQQLRGGSAEMAPQGR